MSNARSGYCRTQSQTRWLGRFRSVSGASKPVNFGIGDIKEQEVRIQLDNGLHSLKSVGKIRQRFLSRDGWTEVCAGSDGSDLHRLPLPREFSLQNRWS